MDQIDLVCSQVANELIVDWKSRDHLLKLYLLFLVVIALQLNPLRH
jgi:hypothetical protein